MLFALLAAAVVYVAPDGRTAPQLIAAHVLPDPVQTPGVFNTAIAPSLDAVTPAEMKVTICTHGWTATVRPPVSYTNKLKIALTPFGRKPGEYELDHAYSIEDLGSPRDPKNLWMMIYADRYGARVKDVLETKVSHLLCAGAITAQQAHDALLPNWLIGYQKYVGPLSK